MQSKRSARRPKNGDGGAHWISYSDMMASLLLLFVLAVFVCVYRLNQQSLILSDKEQEIENQRIIIIGQTASLDIMRIQLGEKQSDLNAALIMLSEQQAELNKAKEETEQMLILLGEKETQLNQLILTNQQQAELLRQKEEEIAQLIGVRGDIIAKLSRALKSADLAAQVDEKTGDIVLESAVLFDRSNYTIKDSGKEFLARFLPVYLNVLLSDEYKDFVGEITIEGHTDTDGDYMNNLTLSQNRARAVAEYCLQLPGINAKQRAAFEKVLSVTGRSESDPVYDPVTHVQNKEASRRVVFKFRLKDTEMVSEMQKLLNQLEGQ